MVKNKLIIGSLFFLLVGTVTAYAADPANVDVSSGGNMSLIRCIDKGGLDFGLFLDSMIYSDGFADGIIEPWKDVLSRNQCQSSDIYSLIKQQDKMRTMIRDAFMTCSTQNLPQLKKAFIKNIIEIYYVRHVVESGLLNSLPVPVAQNSFFKNAAVTDRGTIYAAMAAKYIKSNFLSQEDFDTLFKQLENKYKSRVEQYKDCKNGSWQTVGDKWKEFITFFKDGAGIKEAEKTIGAKAVGTDSSQKSQNSLLNDLKTIKTVQLLTTDESWTDYLKSYAQVNSNDLSPSESLKEVDSYLAQHTSGAGGGISPSEYISAQETTTNLINLTQTTQDLKNHFDGLYKQASDQSLELFLNNLDGRQVQGAAGGGTGTQDTGLIEIINNSFTPLNTILDKSKTMLNRECPG